MDITITKINHKINHKNKKQAQDLTYLLNQYAQDPMGGGKALSKEVLENLADELAKLPHAGSVIAYVDDKPAGLVNFFEAFSTFACKPLINIHDIMVLKEFRGQGLSQMMLAKVEEIAKAKGCCKITLEVLSNNEVAKASYTKYGFKGYELDPKAGHAIFWEKKIPNTETQKVIEESRKGINVEDFSFDDIKTYSPKTNQ